MFSARQIYFTLRIPSIKLICQISGLENFEGENYSTSALISVKTPRRAFFTEGILRKPWVSLESPFSKDENKEFLAYFPEFVETLITEEICKKNLKLTQKIRHLVKYNVDHGTNARGIATVMAYKAFMKSESISREIMKGAIILGWCVRMTESAFAVLDDVVDNSLTRGGQLCWFRKNNIKMRAIIDGAYMQSAVYYVLKKYFSAHPHYLNLVELFLETNYKTNLGQCLDTMTRDLNDFTVDNYDSMVNGKAGYSAIYVSVAAAMLLANISDEEMHRRVKSLLMLLGYYCQVQNDVLDCYGDFKVTGKIGNDIREGKCSWLAVKALEKANKSQIMLMQNNYGIDEDQSFQIIRKLYDDMNLMEEYKRWEEKIDYDIRSEIRQLPENLPHSLFYSLLDKVKDQKWMF